MDDPERAVMDAFGRFVAATGAWPAVMTHGDFHIENILAVDEHVLELDTAPVEQMTRR